MADEADKAADHIERELSARIAAARGRPSLKATTYCTNDCGEKAQPGGRFCSSDCARDAEHRLKMRKISGVTE